MFRAARNSLLVGATLVVLSNVGAVAASMLYAPGGGATRALVIGIDKYRMLGPAAQLGGAVADAEDLAHSLAEAGVETVQILDADASRARIVAEMDRLVATSKPGDFVIISYAGHGMQVPEYAQWKGIEPNGVNEQIAFSGYSFSGDGARDIVVNKELRAWLARLDGKGVDVLVVMDSCFGGGMSRGADTRSGPLVVRALTGDAAAKDRGKFVPIEMTGKEARTEIRGLSHVTFLAGASVNTVVPETTGLDPKNAAAPRGALSYFVARALEGAAASGGSLSREQLFRYVMQNVRQATNGLQIVDIEPRSAAGDSLQRVVLTWTGTRPSDLVTGTGSAAPAPHSSDPVRVAIVNGSPADLATIEKGRAPFVVAASAAAADLVWDITKREVVAHGDIIMQNVDGSLLGGIIDRTAAIRDIRKLSVPRTLTIGLREEGKTYIPGERPEIVADGLRDRYLTVFNIAADGTVQMLFPTGGRDARIIADVWTYGPRVEKPFGADEVVAVTTAQPATEFVDWLKAHNQQRDAGLVSGALARSLAADPSLRVGTVGLYTTASRN